MTLDHKTNHKGTFFFIEMYTSESWINNLSIDVWFVSIGQYLYNYFCGPGSYIITKLT